jgi:HlyD family secretion protein
MMKEKTGNETQTHEDEPSLFEEKQETQRKRKGRLLFVLIAGITVFIFWPRGQIAGEAVLQADRFAKIGLTSSGILKDLLHERGERVKKGSIIARFENAGLKRQFEEKQLVLEILRIEKDRLTSTVKFFTEEKNRKRILYENGVIGQAEFDGTAQEFNAANQALAAKNKEIESAEGELNYVKSRVGALALKAPFDGVLLTDPSPSIGNSFQEGEFVLEFANPETYFLEVLIPEKEIYRLSPGDTAKAKFNAFPKETYEGEVVRISPRTTDQIEKVFKVKHMVACEIRLNALPSDVKYGMRASVQIKTTGRSNTNHDRGTNKPN